MSRTQRKILEHQSSSLVDDVLNMLRRMIRPIVRICLRQGVRFDTLSRIIEEEMVRASAYDPALRTPGHAQNVSRIAFQTGLSRVAVKKALEHIEANKALLDKERWSIESRVLLMWSEDPIFQDEEGHPKTLEIRGGPQSFQGLVQRIGKGTSYGPVLESLEAAGCVQREGNKISFVKPLFIPSSLLNKDRLKAAARASEFYNYYLSTIENNLVSDKEAWMYQQSMYTRYCPEDRIPEFMEFVREKLHEYMSDFEPGLKEFEELPVEKSIVGISMFAFTHDNAEDLPS